jgi:inorganic pyrophosphatase
LPYGNASHPGAAHKKLPGSIMLEHDLPIRNILFDIEGTLVFNKRPIPGAVETVRYIHSEGYKAKFLTNITRRSPGAIAKDLKNLGFDIGEEQIQTATSACIAFLQRRPGKSCHLVVPDSALKMFKGILLNDDDPDYVVISDIGDRFTYAAMDKAFLLLEKGAELIALQKNMFWFDGERKRLDCGAFVAGLEAASGKQAMVMGKPSTEFFDLALETLGASPQETIVVGDDVLTDIEGAGKMRSVLVGTGKFQPDHIKPPYGKHTWFIDSVADLVDLLEDISRLSR